MTTADIVEVRVAADHPAFDGHFPGAPVLPGVVLLSLVFEALRGHGAHRALTAPMTIDHVKWLAAVGPGQRLAIALTRRDGGGVDFEIRRGATSVARGRLLPGCAA